MDCIWGPSCHFIASSASALLDLILFRISGFIRTRDWPPANRLNVHELDLLETQGLGFCGLLSIH